MKRIIAAIAVLLSVMCFAYAYRLQVLGMIQTDVVAVSDRNLAKTLQKGADGDKEPDPVTLEKFRAGDTVYRRGNNLYLGPKKERIQGEYPFYTGDGTGIWYFQATGSLMTDDFMEYEPYAGLFVSDGTAFDDEGVGQDEDTYIFAKLNNGLYMNTVPITIRSNGLDHALRLGSLICFREDDLSAYGYAGERLVYSDLKNLGSAKVVIRDNTYDYHSFVRLIGAVHDPSEPAESPYWIDRLHTIWQLQRKESAAKPIDIPVPDSQKVMEQKRWKQRMGTTHQRMAPEPMAAALKIRMNFSKIHRKKKMTAIPFSPVKNWMQKVPISLTKEIPSREMVSQSAFLMPEEAAETVLVLLVPVIHREAVPAMEAVSQIPVIIPAVKTAAAPILIMVVPRGEPVPEAEAVLEAETITVPPEAAEPVMIWEPAAVITAIRKAAEAPTVVTEAAVIPQKAAVPATATAPAMEMSENQWFLSQMPKQMYIMYTATWRSRIRICV